MHELSITRFIAAPPEKVWDVLANRQNEWWCPRPWRAEVVAQERWAGGRSEITMYGPDGEVMPNNGIFLAWEEGRRFVATDAVTAGFVPAGPFMIGIWEVAPEGDGTRYTASARHWTEEAMRQHDAMGFTQGWNACTDQLQALCESGD
ncbi:SRPBCC family protein [Novosphingobium cyanobacteriorum]|uniref:SRPBCC family protein n=1 Tax=Novosphingobium cyanobacteriorum TaxID=3024215 RepID=A0ABT6CJS2_9SPHN|nr:SRPBCC family protein [Novosphingobium cyanobacteriorum]MDF8334176.1 SRPBCC family protein [Novosphingobium cyanobacteriorum]